MPDEEPIQGPQPADPLFEELAALYDNPEVFSDPSIPLLPKFRLVSVDLQGRPTILTTEISDDLLLALRERAFVMLRAMPGFEAAISADYGKPNWEETREQVVQDPEYLKGEREVYWFFVRHFPPLMARVYDITTRIAVVHAIRLYVNDEAERQTSEKSLKEGIAQLVGELRKDIQRILGTRTRGGSTSKLRDDLRKSLHVQYDRVYEIAKTVKKQCDSLRRAFRASRNRAGLQEWQDFWKDSSTKLFPDYHSTFLDLFCAADNPSASDVTYIWLSQNTGLSQSYVRKRVKELRKASRLAVDQLPAAEGDVQTK